MSSGNGIHPMAGRHDKGFGPSELQAALLALRRELEGISHNDPSARGPRWKMDRIRVQMAVACVACPGGGWQWVPSQGDSPHIVDLEWSLEDTEPEPPMAASGNESSMAVGSASWTPEFAEQLGVVLDGVFGPPGFDSAARATVFRESALEVGPESLHGILTALVEGRPLAESVVERARHAIQRLLERGPAGVKPGAGVLQDVFAKHPFIGLLNLIEARWRYGTGHDLGPL
jgi:hypothetical protein